MTLPNKSVKFLQNYRDYKKDEVRHDIERSYAEKWIRLGYCEAHDGQADGSAGSTGNSDGKKYDAAVAIPNDWQKLNAAQAVSLAKQLGAKSANSGNKADAAIIEALLERAEKGEFQTRMIGDEKTVVALKPWPAYLAISHELLGENSEIVQGKGDDLTITVANGQAQYLIVAEDGPVAIAALVDQKFEAPAPVEGQ